MRFPDFVAERQRPLLRFAMVLCGDAALAEDLVQDVLARCYARWDRLGDVADLNAYVRRMLVNEYVSWQRRWARVRPVADPADSAVADHSGVHADRDALVAELAKLPPKQRAVLVLRFYEGLTDPEIADVLGCRPGTVRGYASRALAALRIELSAPMEAVR